jgi:ATP-dependent helicase HrpB
MKSPSPLPIDADLPRIAQLLRQSRSLVIVAEPGAGKTTRVPPAILRANLLSAEHPNLVMLQPRRVAARASSNRIAEENGWKLGNEVGYHIRFEKRIGPATRLRVLTEGILTRQLLSDPFLEDVGMVILDEFHERSLNTDLAVAMLRELQQTVRPDLYIVIMSATLDAEKAAEFLGGCPIVNVPGRTFPIDIEYQPHGSADLIARVAAAVDAELQKPGGDILVFLPGAEEIRRVVHQLESAAIEHGLAILPLHGNLPADEQMAALRPSAKRKVIVATNIAETSLTIQGVTIVIDSGMARVPAFDPRRGLDRLELKRISKASAKQRCGRAGRTQNGRCVRLWSAKEQAELDDFELPEIRRVDLCAAVLDLHAWGKPDARAFGWFESPPFKAIESAERLLEMLGALDHGKLTSLGKRVMKLPVHPRLGTLLCAAADAECVDEGAKLAALLSEKDIVRPQSGQTRGATTQSDSDLLLRLQYLSDDSHANNLDSMAIRQVRNAYRQLAQLFEASPRGGYSHDTLLKLPLWAYPDRVCRRRACDPSAAAMVGGGGVRLARESAVQKAEFFLALDARHDPHSPTRQAITQIASAISVDWLFEMFPQSIVREKRVVYDAERKRVMGVGVVRYLDLILSEERDSAVDPIEAGNVLAQALRPQAAEIFAGNDAARTFLARVALLRKWMPEHSWPAFDENELGDVLHEVCQRRKSLEEIQGPSLVAALESRLDHRLAKLLREQAPVSLPAPSGSQIALDYSAGQTPVLAVRLQEIFGWTQTPRIADGRVAVLLHLLGPNFRPVQITDDLKSFWSTTYFQVRKDLRVKYPKHSWPDDPLAAMPVAKGRHQGHKRK